jgi:hypothetical protein
MKFLKDSQSSDAVLPQFENVIVTSRFGSRPRVLRRLPPGAALRVMIALSLLIWAGLVGLFFHFFA